MPIGISEGSSPRVNAERIRRSYQGKTGQVGEGLVDGIGHALEEQAPERLFSRLGGEEQVRRRGLAAKSVNPSAATTDWRCRGTQAKPARATSHSAVA